MRTFFSIFVSDTYCLTATTTPQAVRLRTSTQAVTPITALLMGLKQPPQARHQYNPHKESLKSQRLSWGLIWALYGLLVVSQLSWLYYWLRFRLAWLGSRPKHSFAWPTNVDNAKFKTTFQVARRAFGSTHYFRNSYLTAIFCYQIDYRHVWWMSAGTHKGYMIVSYWSQLCHVIPTVEWLP